MKKQLFIVLGLLVVISMLLAACGGGAAPAPAAAPTEAPKAEPTKAPAPTEAPKVEPTKAEAAAPAAGAAGLTPESLKALKGKYKIVWWSWTPQKNDPIMAALKGINRMYPGLELEVERRNLDWGQYPQMVKTSLAAGNAPDIIDIYEAAVSTMDLAAAGQLFDLKAYLDTDPEWKNALLPSALKADSWNQGQHFFTMPISVNNVQFFYNKDLFAKAGVEVPKTLDELKQAAKAFRAMGVQPLVFGVKDQWQAGDMFLTLAAQVAGDTLRKADMRQDKWTNPALVETMKLFKDLQDSGVLADGINGMGYGDAQNLYFAEKAAIWMNGSWVLSALSQWPEGLYKKSGVMLFPQVKSGATPVAVGDYSQNGGLWTESKNLAPALAMYRFLSLDKEAQSIWLPLGEMPVIPWDAATITDENMKTFVAGQGTAFTRMIYDSQANNALLSGIQGMLEGKLTPEQVMETTEKSARTGQLPFVKD